MNLMTINKNINRTLLLIASLVTLTVHANHDSKFCSMEAENWRFTEVDYSSAYNDFGGIFNAPNYPNKGAFAALKSDGSIMAWGSSTNGGINAPKHSGYTKIYSTGRAWKVE
jgi:hypothetical protein